MQNQNQLQTNNEICQQVYKLEKGKFLSIYQNYDCLTLDTYKCSKV